MSQGEIEIVTVNVLPLCPHCDKELTTIQKYVKGIWERHVVYSCPHCNKLLSIGNDTGFGN